jgi:hypothetical protein
MYRGKVMKKKLIIGSLLAVFMLVTISYATAVNNNTNAESKESPLFGIRTRRAVTEKITNIIENIKTKFLGERIFFLPYQWPRNSDLPNLYTEYGKFNTCDTFRCFPLLCAGLVISIKIQCM